MGEETDKITQEHLNQVKKMYPEVEEEFRRIIDRHKNLFKDNPGLIKNFQY